MQRVVAMLIAVGVISGCTVLPPIESHPHRIRWDHEPTVAGRGEALSALVADAVDAWGYGRVVEDCVGADICVSQGFLRGRSELGRAEWDREDPRTCDVWVVEARFAVVAHELGHCFGLGHSTDRRSVMYHQASRERLRLVTLADQRLLARLIAEPSRRVRSEEDGWAFVRWGPTGRPPTVTAGGVGLR